MAVSAVTMVSLGCATVFILGRHGPRPRRACLWRCPPTSGPGGSDQLAGIVRDRRASLHGSRRGRCRVPHPLSGRLPDRARQRFRRRSGDGQPRPGPQPPPPGVSIRSTSPACELGSCTCRAARSARPRRRRAAASSRPPRRARRRPGPTAATRRRSVISDTVASSSTSRSRSMPSPPGVRAGAAAPPPQPLAQHPHRERPLERLDRRVLRVGHAGVDAAHARARTGGRPARRRWSRSTPRPSTGRRRAADQHVVHRPLRRGADPAGHDLGQRAEAHVGDPLAHLDVAGADRGRRAGRRRSCPAARAP